MRREIMQGLESGIHLLPGFLILLLPLLLASGCTQVVRQEEPLTREELQKTSAFDVGGLPQGVGRGLKLDLLTSGLLDPKGHPVAFQALPKARLGYVDWVAAIKRGVLQPRESLEPGAPSSTPVKLDIIFNISHAYPIPDVVFPHEPHTLWLECNNCHPALFVMKQGANPVSMERIIKGEFCGRCHGVVAFPIFDCHRCHSRPKD